MAKDMHITVHKLNDGGVDLRDYVVRKAIKNEAKVWEDDEHDEHTIETYMNEAAALMGNYAANSLKSLKEDYELEAYEAACNSIKESFCKKVDEAKEANMAPSNEAPEENEDPAATL